jgi:hypothetical protein
MGRDSGLPGLPVVEARQWGVEDAIGSHTISLEARASV